MGRTSLLQVSSQFSVASHLRISLEQDTTMIAGTRFGLAMKTKVTGVLLSPILTGELKISSANTRIAYQNPNAIKLIQLPRMHNIYYVPYVYISLMFLEVIIYHIALILFASTL